MNVADDDGGNAACRCSCVFLVAIVVFVCDFVFLRGVCVEVFVRSNQSFMCDIVCSAYSQWPHVPRICV